MSAAYFAMQIRQEAQENELAAKVIDGLDRLDEKPESAKRWIWELIQNAKDASLGLNRPPVKIEVIFTPENVEFRHSGNPFSTKDLVSLICQTSMKERSLDENKVPETTGKFGTGFITTHLLSRVIIIKGIYKSEKTKEGEEKYSRFELVLDRSSNDKQIMIEKSKQAFELFENIDKPEIYPILENFEIGKNCDTSFIYPLNSNSLDIAKQGIKDFKNSVFQMLLFNPQIESILLLDQISQTEDFYRVTKKEQLEGEVQMYTVSNKSIEKYYMKAQKNYTSVCFEVKKHANTFQIVPKPPQAPILFADFPLVGSELHYTYPCYLNSHIFWPNEERSSVQIITKPTYYNNQKTFKESIDLIFSLFDCVIRNKWEGIHNLAIIKRPNVQNSDWFYKEIMIPYMEKFANQKIIQTALGNQVSLKKVKFIVYDGDEYERLPSMYEQRQMEFKNRFERLWVLLEKIEKENLICNDFQYVQTWESILIQDWIKILPQGNKIGLEKIISFISSSESLRELKRKLKEDPQPQEWLQKFYYFVINYISRYSQQSIIQKERLFLNQKQQFKFLQKMSSDIDIEESYKELCLEFGYDLKDILLEKICTKEVDIFVANFGSQMKFSQVEYHIHQAITHNCEIRTQEQFMLSKVKYNYNQQTRLVLNLIAFQKQGDSQDEGNQNVQEKNARTQFYDFIKVFKDSLPIKRSVINYSEKIFQACQQHMIKLIQNQIASLNNLSQLVSVLQVENKKEHALQWLNQFYQYYIRNLWPIENLKVILNEKEQFVTFRKPKLLQIDYISAWLQEYSKLSKDDEECKGIKQFLLQNEDAIRNLYQIFYFLENKQEIDLASGFMHPKIVDSLLNDIQIQRYAVKVTMQHLFKGIDDIICKNAKNLEFIRQNSKELWQIDKIYKSFESNQEVYNDLMIQYSFCRKEIIFELVSDPETKDMLTNVLTKEEGKEILSKISKMKENQIKDLANVVNIMEQSNITPEKLMKMLEQNSKEVANNQENVMQLGSQEQSMPSFGIDVQVSSIDIEQRKNQEFIASFDLQSFLVQNCVASKDQLEECLKHLNQERRDFIWGRFSNSLTAFEAVMRMLKRSVENVKRELEKNSPPYDVTNWTIMSHLSLSNHNIVQGVKKYGVEIKIVIRPTDFSRLIFHNRDEVEALKENQAELWGDNGFTTKQINLGEIVDWNNIRELRVPF